MFRDEDKNVVNWMIQVLGGGLIFFVWARCFLATLGLIELDADDVRKDFSSWVLAMAMLWVFSPTKANDEDVKKLRKELDDIKKQIPIRLEGEKDGNDYMQA